MKKFFSKKNLGWLVAAILGGVVIYDHFDSIREGYTSAKKWVGEKCSEDEKPQAENENPEPKPTEPEEREEQQPKSENRYERRPYYGKYNNNKK